MAGFASISTHYSPDYFDVATGGISKGYTSEYDPLAARMQREGFQNQRDVANIQNAPARMGQKRFDWWTKNVWPMASGAFGGMAGGGGSGGAGGTQPQINSGPLFTQDMMQRQINNGMATNAQQLAGQQNTMNQSLAARGFGTGSPLAQALSTQMGMANNAANATLQRELPQQYAQANADQLFRTQQAQEQQYAARQNEAINRQQIATSTLNALLGALGSSFH